MSKIELKLAHCRQILRVDKDATLKEIRTSFRKLSLRCSPQMNQKNKVEARKMFEIAQTAYITLVDHMKAVETSVGRACVDGASVGGAKIRMSGSRGRSTSKAAGKSRRRAAGRVKPVKTGKARSGGARAGGQTKRRSAPSGCQDYHTMKATIINGKRRVTETSVVTRNGSTTVTKRWVEDGVETIIVKKDGKLISKTVGGRRVTA